MGTTIRKGTDPLEDFTEVTESESSSVEITQTAKGDFRVGAVKVYVGTTTDVAALKAKLHEAAEAALDIALHTKDRIEERVS